MKCDSCQKEFTYEDDILCENGYLYHKDCPFDPYKRREKGSSSNTVMVVYAMRKGEDIKDSFLEIPWIYGVFRDKEKGFFIQEYMQNSKEYGHLYWGNNVTKLK